ncbi:uncharacterized protein A4U43_C07F14090 [Asparagus officinalis]|uniref:soluble epoxide hydrolase n=1 Tax=Asparagus officinalis TaxID=4686 RepID=A0A5P1EBT4_ASPOF|nr:uncharacterized protein A4U43_C07F14090 [Asparagus officinalis]
MADGEIAHRTVAVNGISMHVAEKGDGPVVLLIHGFPELWYAWRHQIVGLAGLGYRCVAPDLRGYGDTQVPGDVNDYTVFQIVGDLVALIDSLGQEKVLVVGHDWGAMLAWNLCLFRPDKVKALVALSVPFTPRNPARKTIESLRATYGDDYYICRFQEPGAIESEFARLGTSLVLKKFFTYRNPGPLFIPKEGWGSPSEQITLPPWLSEDDISYYESKFDKSGFTGGVNYYRCLDSNTFTNDGSLSSDHNADENRQGSQVDTCRNKNFSSGIELPYKANPLSRQSARLLAKRIYKMDDEEEGEEGEEEGLSKCIGKELKKLLQCHSHCK